MCLLRQVHAVKALTSSGSRYNHLQCNSSETSPTFTKASVELVRKGRGGAYHSLRKGFSNIREIVQLQGFQLLPEVTAVSESGGRNGDNLNRLLLFIESALGNYLVFTSLRPWQIHSPANDSVHKEHVASVSLSFLFLLPASMGHSLPPLPDNQALRVAASQLTKPSFLQKTHSTRFRQYESVARLLR